MSDELNRRVAELSGWRMRLNEDEWWELFPPVEGSQPAWAVEGMYQTPDDAWLAAVEAGALPDYSGDPSAALALLAGDRLLWDSHTWYVDFDRMIGVYFEADGTEWEGVAQVVNGDEARAFAEAAAAAWCQWKEAGDD